MIARIVTAVALAVAYDASAYEQATHGYLTQRAYAASELGSVPDDGAPPLTARLGLDTYLPFGGLDRYFEFITTAFRHVGLPATFTAL